MLDDDELMYTRILNHNATPNEITDYIDILHKENSKLLKTKSTLKEKIEKINICKRYSYFSNN